MVEIQIVKVKNIATDELLFMLKMKTDGNWKVVGYKGEILQFTNEAEAEKAKKLMLEKLNEVTVCKGIPEQSEGMSGANSC